MYTDLYRGYIVPLCVISLCPGASTGHLLQADMCGVGGLYSRHCWAEGYRTQAQLGQER